MNREEKQELREQLKSDIKHSPNNIPEELERELMMDVRKHPWIFAMSGYERALKMKYPEYTRDIKSVFGGQLALGRMLKWGDESW